MACCRRVGKFAEDFLGRVRTGAIGSLDPISIRLFREPAQMPRGPAPGHHEVAVSRDIKSLSVHISVFVCLCVCVCVRACISSVCVPFCAFRMCSCACALYHAQSTPLCKLLLNWRCCGTAARASTLPPTPEQSELLAGLDGEEPVRRRPMSREQWRKAEARRNRSNSGGSTPGSVRHSRTVSPGRTVFLSARTSIVPPLRLQSAICTGPTMQLHSQVTYRSRQLKSL